MPLLGGEMNNAAYKEGYYNIFAVCSEFRQRLAQLQRLKPKKQQSKQKDVIKS